MKTPSWLASRLKTFFVGRRIYFNGDVYEGIFNSTSKFPYYGVKHGQGKYTFPNGTVYSGRWRHDGISGRGRCVYPTGNVYDGHWKNGKKHGLGTITILSSGEIYSGQWIEDTFCGDGSHPPLTFEPGIVDLPHQPLPERGFEGVGIDLDIGGSLLYCPDLKVVVLNAHPQKQPKNTFF